MDSDLSHEAIKRFEDLETRLSALEESLGITPSEGENEGESEDGEGEESESEPTPPTRSRRGRREPEPVAEESAIWTPEGTE